MGFFKLLRSFGLLPRKVKVEDIASEDVVIV